MKKTSRSEVRVGTRDTDHSAWQAQKLNERAGPEEAILPDVGGSSPCLLPPSHHCISQGLSALPGKQGSP